MDIRILDVVIVTLLVTLLLLAGRKKTDYRPLVASFERSSKEQQNSVAEQIRDGAAQQFQRFGVIQQNVQSTLQSNREEVNKQLSGFQEQLDKRLAAIQQSSVENNDKINSGLNKTLQEGRTETDKKLQQFQTQIDGRLSAIQRGNTENIEKLNATLKNEMKSLQESNEKRLGQMQDIVDEKLQKTLETRLAQSFELVGKQLNDVQKGLGEMKNLAADARSLKNVLTNVKERGTYGEVRLEKLLSDILAASQYETNVEIGSNKRVEFAVKMPGNGDTPILLPIDSKFPLEDYNRLLDAEDKPEIDEARKSLAKTIRSSAKDIHDKYIMPPKTTEFALMFLPTEGLYAEVLQNAALFEELRDKYKVTPVGATTLGAFLASLQIGFKTLAIERRSQEVWDTLRKVKAEFDKFGTMLDKAHKQIQTVDKTLEEIRGTRTRAIDRALRNVERDEIDDAPAPLSLEPVKP